MAAFFDQFEDFIPSAFLTPEANFDRLKVDQQWSPEKSTSQRRAFLRAFLGSPVHDCFIKNYLNIFPDYNPSAAPHGELSRLRSLLGKKGFKNAKKRFIEAFEEEFNSPIDIFFEGFYHCHLEFDYNPRVGAIAELLRLKTSKNWGEEEWEDILEKFREAFEGEFNELFGINEDDEAGRNWLCALLGVDPIPPSKTQCKKELAKIHVNIYDVLEVARGQRLKSNLEIFPTVKKLSKYSTKAHKVFPKEDAKRGAIRYLLRGLFGPKGH